MDKASVEEYIKLLEHGNINQRAAAIFLRYGWIDGKHHKQWIIDQMLKLICGAAYPTVISYYEQQHGKWDEGIAP